MIRWLAVLAFACLAPLAHAEQYVDSPPYRVHYATINTSELAPEVAREFSIQRTRNEILLVLNVQQRIDSHWVPVPATASGTATTLLGHVETLALRPVHEAEVHYVIAPFETLDGEFMTIDAQVLPQGANTPIAVSFRKQFFRD